jgi:hypothetical protein
VNKLELMLSDSIGTGLAADVATVRAITVNVAIIIVNIRFFIIFSPFNNIRLFLHFL